MHTHAQLTPRHFSYDEFQRMGELGILPQGGVELIAGEVLERNGRGTPRRWTYDEYVRMGEAGILSEDERTELIDGEIVCMTPVGHRHIYVVDLLTEYLGAWTRGRAVLRVQSPLVFHGGEAPHPDLTVLRPHPDRYRSRQAGPWDALLVVEVADSSLQEDRDVKGPRYARAAIPEYWIAELNASSVIVHLNPEGGEYLDLREYGYGEAFTSPALGGHEVRVEDVLGPAAPER